MTFLEEIKSRLRSWRDVNQFIFRTLSPPNVPLALLSLTVFTGGLVLWIGEVAAGAWIAMVIGLLGIAKDVFYVVARWITSPCMSLKTDDRISTILPRLRLSQDYIDMGYTIDTVPDQSCEYVARSPKVDAFLRTNDLPVQNNPALLDPVIARLKINDRVLGDALRCQYRLSWRSDPPRRFINEMKTCMQTDLFTRQTEIAICRSSYFLSFLTNELSTRVLESRGSHPQVLYRGSEGYPAFLESDGFYVLKRLSESLMSNHIGVSTIVHTIDNQLVLWRQSDGAQQSCDRLAPTGSGSCDWSDWVDVSCRNSLKALVSRAMEREIGEESRPLEAALKGIPTKTEVLGYFRWLRRGGKPEFVGITKIGAPASCLKPNILEVDAPDYLRLVYPADTVMQLKQSVKNVLASKRLSVPLVMNLACLLDAFDDDPDRWASFLSIPP